MNSNQIASDSHQTTEVRNNQIDRYETGKITKKRKEKKNNQLNHVSERCFDCHLASGERTRTR